MTDEAWQLHLYLASFRKSSRRTVVVDSGLKSSIASRSVVCSEAELAYRLMSENWWDELVTTDNRVPTSVPHEEVKRHLHKCWRLAWYFFDEAQFALSAFFAIALIEEIGKLIMVAANNVELGRAARAPLRNHEELGAGGDQEVRFGNKQGNGSGVATCPPPIHTLTVVIDDKAGTSVEAMGS